MGCDRWWGIWGCKAAHQPGLLPSKGERLNGCNFIRLDLKHPRSACNTCQSYGQHAKLCSDVCPFRPLQLGQYAEAIADYSHVIALQHNDTHALHNRLGSFPARTLYSSSLPIWALTCVSSLIFPAWLVIISSPTETTNVGIAGVYFAGEIALIQPKEHGTMSIDMLTTSLSWDDCGGEIYHSEFRSVGVPAMADIRTMNTITVSS